MITENKKYKKRNTLAHKVKKTDDPIAMTEKYASGVESPRSPLRERNPTVTTKAETQAPKASAVSIKDKEPLPTAL